MTQAIGQHAERWSRTGVGSWITTTDHKRIGLLYIVTTVVFFLTGVALALLMRLQLALPNGKVLDPGTYNQVFTMHGTTMIFLFLMPMLIGLGNYFVPLMIGARDMAFPRLNAFGYWVFLFGGLLMDSSSLFGAAPNAGWFAYAPLTENQFNMGPNMNFWALGINLLGISSIASAINFIVTIIKLRAPQMSLTRLPLFVWNNLMTSFIILGALPSLTAASVLLLLDRYLGTSFYLVPSGGDPLLWQHLFWNFGHPEVYVLILPAMGIISEVIPVFSRKPLFGYVFVAWSTVAITFLSFAVWAHHMFTVGLPFIADAFFSAASFAIAVPTGVKIFNWIATMWGGNLILKTPMLFAAGFIFMFIIGGMSGVAQAVVPVDWQVQDSYFVVGHIHYVLFGGSVFAVFAGLYYWFPKMTGRMLDDRLGRLHCGLKFVGINLTFFPFHILGLLGMPRRVYTFQSGLGWEGWNFLSTIGAFIIALSILIFLWNVFVSLRRGERAGDDPWDAWTLEWATSSPPPPHNFVTLPLVRSLRPLWDEKHPEDSDWRRGQSDFLRGRLDDPESS